MSLGTDLANGSRMSSRQCSRSHSPTHPSLSYSAEENIASAKFEIQLVVVPFPRPSCVSSDSALPIQALVYDDCGLWHLPRGHSVDTQ